MGQRVHMCLDIRQALENPKELNYFTKDDGTFATWREARDFLIEELRKGYDYMAFGGCTNRKPNGRCAGHLENPPMVIK